MRFELKRPFLFQIFNSRGGSVLVFKETKEEAVETLRSYFWNGLSDEEKPSNEEIEEEYLVGSGPQNFFIESALVRHLVDGKDLGNCGNGVKFLRPQLPKPITDDEGRVVQTTVNNVLLAIPRNLDIPGMVEVRMDDDAFTCLILR